ncbi:hypothetical protein KGQ20_19130 [Catenulispora sp. NF23]|uniref:DUF6401 family natural product biosynthesis protein n=1 Tax=Catenulispora pinistramenti TaxID=2705254 RepID=UPI001BA5DB4C|nr:DUF6401 family natural product biosynthesis protein [Catenulispora pinistramenti]MBS2534888.1 hypothetical protein [Catenulispora pinistramenti]
MDFPPHDDAPPLASPLAGVVAAFMPRLAEFAFEPGLLAAIDQHAAAVCDTLSSEPLEAFEALAALEALEAPIPMQRTVGREELTDYVLGFNDVLAEKGWEEPVGYDFATLRLTAICWLVREQDLLAF